MLSSITLFRFSYYLHMCLVCALSWFFFQPALLTHWSGISSPFLAGNCPVTAYLLFSVIHLAQFWFLWLALLYWVGQSMDSSLIGSIRCKTRLCLPLFEYTYCDWL